MPVCDQLAECLVLPAMFRPATGRHVVTIFGTNACGIRDAGAIPASSILRATNLSSALIYDSERRGLVSCGLLSATVRTATLAFQKLPGVTHETAERLPRLFAVESCDDGVARIRHENCRAREIGTHPLTRGEGEPT